MDHLQNYYYDTTAQHIHQNLVNGQHTLNRCFVTNVKNFNDIVFRCLNPENQETPAGSVTQESKWFRLNLINLVYLTG